MSGPKLDLSGLDLKLNTTEPNPGQEAADPLAKTQPADNSMQALDFDSIDFSEDGGTGVELPGFNFDNSANDPLAGLETNLNMIPSVEYEPKKSNGITILISILGLCLMLFVASVVMFMKSDPVDAFLELLSGNTEPIAQALDEVSTEISFLLGIGADPSRYPAEIAQNSIKIDNLPAYSPGQEGAGVETIEQGTFLGQVDSIYARLPNSVLGFSDSWLKEWTRDEEQRITQMAVSEFLFQRYSAVQEIYRLRLKSGIPILKQIFLQEDKLWIRLRAAVALAGVGEEVKSTELREVLESSSQQQLIRFFRRFQDWSTPSERYVMREALKVTPPKVRAEILKGLMRFSDSYTNLYAAAASLENSRAIKTVMASHWPLITVEELGNFQAVAEGDKVFELAQAYEGVGGYQLPVEDEFYEEPTRQGSLAKGLQFGRIIIYRDTSGDIELPELIKDF